MLSIHDNKIDSTNGVFNIEDTTNNPIKIYNNKIINTDNYIISDSYVFKKNTAIPLIYFAFRNSDTSKNGSIQYSLLTKNWIEGTNNNIYLGNPTLPSYFDSLIKAKNIRNYVLKGSWVQSRVTWNADIGIAELNQWNSTHDFIIGRYNLSNLAPLIIMDYAGSNTENGVFIFSESNNILNLVVYSTNYTYVTLYVQFI